MQHWWMHFLLCPWGWRQGVAPAIACTLPAHEEATLPLSLLPLLWPSPLQSPLPSPSLSLTPSSLPLPSPIAVAVDVSHCCCGCRQPSPLPSLLHRHQLLPLLLLLLSLLPLPLAIAVFVIVGHCSCHLRWPLPSPLLSAISNRCCLGAARIVFDQFKQRMLNFLFWLDSGQRIDQSWMTDQMLSIDGQRQHWAASSEQWVASEGSGWQHGGRRGAAGWRRWLTMGGVVLLCCWGISLWQMAYVMMCWMW